MKDQICPCCNGTRRVALPERSRSYKSVIAGYDSATDTIPCKNCGGQYMYGTPTGLVALNSSGAPCTHTYSSANVGRCLTRYTCIHCKDSYTIDSGD